MTSAAADPPTYLHVLLNQLRDFLSGSFVVLVAHETGMFRVNVDLA
jgi:hypothetical protein